MSGMYTALKTFYFSRLRKDLTLSLIASIGALFISFLSTGIIARVVSKPELGLWIFLNNLLVWITFIDFGLRLAFQQALHQKCHSRP